MRHRYTVSLTAAVNKLGSMALPRTVKLTVEVDAESEEHACERVARHLEYVLESNLRDPQP